MLKLLLPVIFPSWRFFSSMVPSPRIQIAFMENDDMDAALWEEFRPRPQVVSLWEGVKRLFHNPDWNEKLYINTCAERLFEGYSEMREQEIMCRILNAIALREINMSANTQFVVFRIIAIIREGSEVTQQVTFVSRPASLKEARVQKGGNLWF